MKQIIRANFITSRKNLTQAHKTLASAKIAKCCFDFIANKKFQNVALYYPINDEVYLLKMISMLNEISVNIGLPIIHADTMDFLLYRPYDLLIKVGKLIEPLPSAPIFKPDIIVTPLLSFDRKGNRTGYGGGFYDRAFAKNPNIFKLGVAFATQEYAGILPIEAHDISLNLIITEEEIIWTPSASI